jgi:osmoprotectant transport system ATP-binding protein
VNTPTATGFPIELRGVSRSFGTRPGLRDLELSFAAGSITAVVGASGCGKSTLLKLCNGLLRPDAGELRVFGEAMDYERLPQLRRRMGYAVQGTGLFPHLRARDNVTLVARLEGWTRDAIDARIDELLALMHLDAGLLDRYPHQLSGGQQQRVGLCRSMMLRPEVLLLDEPFAAIDPITRQDIHEQFLELLAAEPATVVLVTHDMREAMLLAKRVLVMREGSIFVDTQVADLREGHASQDPADLLRELLREPS